MSDSFNFSVVTPEQTYLDGEASMVVVPGIEGDIGFLANHANIITSLRPGTIEEAIKKSEKMAVEAA